ncbi:SSI family serine proteinase inhibitor [Streptomyces roseolus]|uniref:SSI family serine proteinase inhibitor n=1 Tax=Streptomyces roseolus TaxID=67358 RepID=UPI0036405644
MNPYAPTALLAALLLAAPAVGASASDAGPVVPAPTTTLRLTVTGPAPDTTAPSPESTAVPAPAARTVTLQCDPAGGDHPRADAACADLDASQGRVDRESGTACILLYDPVEVRAEGLWRGRPVSFARQYGNSCELSARTGAIFAF